MTILQRLYYATGCATGLSLLRYAFDKSFLWYIIMCAIMGVAVSIALDQK